MALPAKTVRLMSNHYQNLFDDAVLNMHDWKGVLEVTCDHEARVIFEGVVPGAWERIGEPLVSHHLPDRK